MAPSAPTPAPSKALETVERETHAVVQTLYELMVSVTNWEKPDSADVVMKSITDLVSQFQALSSSSSHLTTLLPREVIQYVEDGRNPDIYTREFVEIVLKYNQLMNGKRKAYERFHKVLNDQMLTAFPELTEEIEKVRLNTVAKK